MRIHSQDDGEDKHSAEKRAKKSGEIRANFVGQHAEEEASRTNAQQNAEIERAPLGVLGAAIRANAVRVLAQDLAYPGRGLTVGGLIRIPYDIVAKVLGLLPESAALARAGPGRKIMRRPFAEERKNERFQNSFGRAQRFEQRRDVSLSHRPSPGQQRLPVRIPDVDVRTQGVHEESHRLEVLLVDGHMQRSPSIGGFSR